MNLPSLVLEDEWQAARQKLLVHEKEATRTRDVLVAERRRLPMVEFETDYLFEGPEAGRASRQAAHLVIYSLLMAWRRCSGLMASPERSSRAADDRTYLR